jgi:hypothetical protein
MLIINFLLTMIYFVFGDDDVLHIYLFYLRLVCVCIIICFIILYVYLCTYVCFVSLLLLSYVCACGDAFIYFSSPFYRIIQIGIALQLCLETELLRG